MAHNTITSTTDNRIRPERSGDPAESTVREPVVDPRGCDFYQRLDTAGAVLIRYGLVLVIGWIGAMKFTSYEAHAIEPLVRNSPLLSWTYHVLSVQTFSCVLGVVELTIALVIAARPLSAVLSAIGSGLAVGMFLTTLTFLFSTPGWEPTLGGFPALSPLGGFLVKDVVLLGAAVWSMGEALRRMP